MPRLTQMRKAVVAFLAMAASLLATVLAADLVPLKYAAGAQAVLLLLGSFGVYKAENASTASNRHDSGD